MKSALTIAVAAAALLASTACQSTHRRSPGVDDAYLASVSSDARGEIAELRTERAEMNDEVAFAERRVEDAKARKKIAEQEVGIAKQEVSRAEARLDVVDSNDDAWEDAQEELAAARAHVRWAEAQVRFHETGISAAKADLALAKERVDLADTRVELRKAEAIAELDEESGPEIDLDAYRSDVEEAEMRVQLAEIERDAWNQKAEARRDLVTRRAEGTPEERRASWETIEPVEAGTSKDKKKD